MLAKIKAFVKGIALLAIIPTVVVAIDILGFFTGGLMTVAVVSGVALVLSMVFVTLNFKEGARNTFNRVIGSNVGWIDLAQTVLLTYVGFKLSVTMGLVMLVVGLNISMYLCALRTSRILCDKTARTEFCREVGFYPQIGLVPA